MYMGHNVSYLVFLTDEGIVTIGSVGFTSLYVCAHTVPYVTTMHWNVRCIIWVWICFLIMPVYGANVAVCDFLHQNWLSGASAFWGTDGETGEECSQHCGLLQEGPHNKQAKMGHVELPGSKAPTVDSRRAFVLRWS